MVNENAEQLQAEIRDSKSPYTRFNEWLLSQDVTWELKTISIINNVDDRASVTYNYRVKFWLGERTAEEDFSYVREVTGDLASLRHVILYAFSDIGCIFPRLTLEEVIESSVKFEVDSRCWGDDYRSDEEITKEVCYEEYLLRQKYLKWQRFFGEDLLDTFIYLSKVLT